MSGFLTALQCTNFVFGRGFALDLAGGAYSTLPDPRAGLRALLQRDRGGKDGVKGADRNPPPLSQILDPPLEMALHMAPTIKLHSF